MPNQYQRGQTALDWLVNQDTILGDSRPPVVAAPSMPHMPRASRSKLPIIIAAVLVLGGVVTIAAVKSTKTKPTSSQVTPEAKTPDEKLPEVIKNPAVKTPDVKTPEVVQTPEVKTPEVKTPEVVKALGDWCRYRERGDGRDGQEDDAEDDEDDDQADDAEDAEDRNHGYADEEGHWLRRRASVLIATRFSLDLPDRPDQAARIAHLVISVFTTALHPTSQCGPTVVRFRAMDRSFALTPGKRVLYLTKDPDRIRQQLAGTLTLKMSDSRADELLDDINTDAMTPAWVCFDFDPNDIAKNAYAGLIVNGERLITPTRSPTAASR